MQVVTLLDLELDAECLFLKAPRLNHVGSNRSEPRDEENSHLLHLQSGPCGYPTHERQESLDVDSVGVERCFAGRRSCTDWQSLTESPALLREPVNDLPTSAGIEGAPSPLPEYESGLPAPIRPDSRPVQLRRDKGNGRRPGERSRPLPAGMRSFPLTRLQKTQDTIQSPGDGFAVEYFGSCPGDAERDLACKLVVLIKG